MFSSKNFPSSATKEDIAKKFHMEFQGRFEIFAIQVKPGNVIAVTSRSAEAKKALTKNQYMDVDGIVCPVLNYVPSTTLVMVHYFPIEADGKPLYNQLSQYGQVVGSRFQVWIHLGEISTGTQLYNMHLNCDVPRSPTVKGHCVKTWYKGQHLTCDICGGCHKAAQCDLRGKCRRCKSEGHFAKDCPTSWGKSAPAPAPTTTGSDPTPAEAAGQSEETSQPPVVAVDSASVVEDGANQPTGAVDSAAGASQYMNCAVDSEDGASQSILAGVEVPAVQLVDNSGDVGVLSGSGQSVDLRDNQLDKLPSADVVVSDVPVVTVLSEGDSLANVDLGDVLNSGKSLGHLSVSQRGGVVSLSFKKSDRLDPRNWRPINLLNVDYKIASRAIAARLLRVIHLVVAKDQTRSVPGRFIGENVAFLRDVVDFCSLSGSPVTILLLDQEKAFDRVDRGFLCNTLEVMGFGPSFVDWVLLFSSNVESSVNVNSYLWDFFSLSCGVRQGCPLSPLLYFLWRGGDSL